MSPTRMTGQQRRTQVLAVAEQEFAVAGLHGVSTETIAHRAGITQAYVFRLFGTKKQLFLACVDAAFERMRLALLAAAGDTTGIDALTAMGREYNAMLSDRTTLLLQLQGTAAAAAGDAEVRDAVRGSFGRLWQAVADTARLDPVTVKAFLAFGMLLNTNAALELADVDERWARQARTRIRPGLFTHITRETNQ
ncbi:TetR/AcrR family transcriptional regulator [Actinopolymorpha pittospori]|uniref:AcrR family transcriptional regulator n=1 Tax=Actinopolymorpha pittospori TaxID=648752 RepID=A0A927MXI9_9ACTN|nr:helix-turn-helix domain-containing protein [Actinopolymorpha pittospori]MBE1608424.1 AcrR family transcriptional regulator [Actinopolymorpha pittospori]